MHRTRTWNMDQPVLRGRNRVLPIEGGDGSTLSLDFTAMSGLDSRFTFSRSSTATIINSSGLVQYADANLILQSESLATSPWIPTNGASVADVSTTNPIGGSTATQLTAGGANNSVLQAPSIAANVPHTVRFWVRGGTSTQMHFGYFSGSFQTASNITVVGSGSVTGTGLMTITGLSTTTWTQVTFVLASPAASGSLLFYPDTASPTVGRTNFVWGVQINAGSTASAYNRTTTSAYHAPRFDHDPTTLAPRGLLIEGSATNLVTQSSAMNNWTFTRATASTPSVIAPDGASTSVLATGTADVNNHLVQNANSISFTSQNYTFSVWLKAGSTNFAQLSFTNSLGFPTNTFVNVNLSNGTLGTLGGAGATATISTAYPNGWYRVTLTANQTLTTSHTGSCLIYLISSATAARAESWNASSASVYVFGAQLEAGSGASSYIPTGSSTVQRAVDQMTMANISALSFNQAGGTVFMQIEGNPRDVNTFPYFAAFEQSPSGRGWAFLRLNNSTTAGLRMLGTAFTSAGSTIISSTVHTRPSGTFKFATTLEPSVCRMTYVIAGGSALVDTATAGTLATIGSLKFNNTTETGASEFGSVWMSQFKYWPSVLPNATLQSLTA